eukprot:m.1425075 g.1425075  ORF g.1425075 m.1425075 type:complete len:108 (-) comp25064_c0_seq1:653-976(-)
MDSDAIQQKVCPACASEQGCIPNPPSTDLQLNIYETARGTFTDRSSFSKARHARAQYENLESADPNSSPENDPSSFCRAEIHLHEKMNPKVSTATIANTGKHKVNRN